MTCSRTVTLADGAQLDAFSRLRVSDANLIFQVQNQYDAEPLYMEAGTTGTGVAPAHSTNTRMVTLSATAGTGTSFLQSYEYTPYIPGRSQFIFITGVMGTAVASAVKDVGVFDANNGVFYRQNGTSGLQFVRRTSTSGSVENEAVNQANWNEDPLDGTGKSGYTLDPTKSFILVIDAQFLAMGRVRFGFDIEGCVCWAHHFDQHANVLAVPYMQTLTLPVQALLTASSSGGAAEMQFKCASVSSEGGQLEHIGYTFATPEVTVTAASGAATHILSLRAGTTFATLANRAHLTLDAVELLVTGNFPIRWELWLGATFSAAPTWSSVNATYSGAQYTSTVGTVLSTGSLMFDSGYLAASAGTKSSVTIRPTGAYPLTLDRAGNTRAMGTVSLIVYGIGGASATRASFNYTEVR